MSKGEGTGQDRKGPAGACVMGRPPHDKVVAGVPLAQVMVAHRPVSPMSELDPETLPADPPLHRSADTLKPHIRTLVRC